MADTKKSTKKPTVKKGTAKKAVKKTAKKKGVNKGGRPKKYSPTFANKKLEKYLESCDETLMAKKKGGYFTLAKLPTHEGFAFFLNIAVSTLYEWAKKHKKFSEALEAIKAKQKQRLVQRGLEGTYNPQMAKLILSHNHGVHEKSVQEVKKDPNEEIKVDDLPLDELRKRLNNLSPKKDEKSN